MLMYKLSRKSSKKAIYVTKPCSWEKTNVGEGFRECRPKLASGKLPEANGDTRDKVAGPIGSWRANRGVVQCGEGQQI